MNREKILEALRDLAKSQGSYGRFLRNLEELREDDPYTYEAYMKELENEEFADVVDLVMYLES